MFNLLKFYLPRVAKNIFILFVLAVVTGALCLNSPLDKEVSMGCVVLIFVIFPLYAYFNPSNYLSASIGWILQTPIPKKQIILANGIINIFKVILLFLLINLVFYFVEQEAFFKLYDGVFSSNTVGKISSGIQDQFTNLFLIIAMLAVVFGILPDVLNSAQEKRQQAGQFDFKNMKPKKIIKNFSLAVLVILFSVIAESDAVSSLIFYNVAFSLFLFISFYMTLRSVKYVYNIKLLFVATLITFIAGSFISYLIAVSQVNNLQITLDKRFESADFLGDYAGKSYESLFSELQTGDDSTVDLGYSDLQKPARLVQNKKLVLSTIDALDKLCKERSDHTCRLNGYLSANFHHQAVAVNYFRLGCPNDLASCYHLGGHKDAKTEDMQLVDETMTERCKNSKNDFETKNCKRYYDVKAKAEKKLKPKS